MEVQKQDSNAVARFVRSVHAIFSRSAMAKAHDLSGRHFLVTGCAKDSLGYATAVQLLKQGGVVSITTRTGSAEIASSIRANLPKKYHGNLHPFDLDISQKASVERFLENYRHSALALDVLINNAGIHYDLMSQWKAPKLSEDGYEIHWRVNYLGTVHLTLSLLPLLLASANKTGDARIVNLVSMLHYKGLNSEFVQPSRPYNSWNSYGQSKLALVHFTRSLARMFSEHRLTSYCLHPGSVYTNIADKGLSGTGLIQTIRNALSPLERLFLKTPFEGAQTSIHCATAPLSELESGKYYRNLKIAEMSKEAADSMTADRLWRESVDWLDGSQTKIEMFNAIGALRKSNAVTE